MNKFTPLGRLFFAIGLGAFGILQFIYRDFVPGRAPAWPAGIGGRLVWAYVSGAALIAAGAAIIFGKKARLAAIVSGAMIFLWALLRHIPLAAAGPSFGLAWTNTGKALALFGGAFALAGSLPDEKGSGALSAIINSRDGFLYLGRLCLGLFMILAGIQHFLFVEFVATLVPGWIPGALFWAYFAGVALIAGGAGLILPYTARLAAALSGLMIFLWVVLLHVPRAVSGLYDSRNEWTSMFEALAFSGLALLLSGALPRPESTPASKRSYAGAGQ
jgi:uncharacterized membrane protein